MRDALRSLMAESELATLQGDRVVAVLLTACDIRRRDVDERMVELRNDFEDIVVENLHRYIEDEYRCLLGSGRA